MSYRCDGLATYTQKWSSHRVEGKDKKREIEARKWADSKCLLVVVVVVVMVGRFVSWCNRQVSRKKKKKNSGRIACNSEVSNFITK